MHLATVKMFFPIASLLKYTCPNHSNLKPRIQRQVDSSRIDIFISEQYVSHMDRWTEFHRKHITGDVVIAALHTCIPDIRLSISDWSLYIQDGLPNTSLNSQAALPIEIMKYHTNKYNFDAASFRDCGIVKCQTAMQIVHCCLLQ